MEKISYKILKENLEGTYLYPKYPNGDLFESNQDFPFVDSSISQEQFKKEAQRFDPLNSFWNILDYSNLESLKNKKSIFVMHPFKEEIIHPNQLAIPIKTISFLNHKGNVNYLNSNLEHLEHNNFKIKNVGSVKMTLKYLLKKNLLNKDFVLKVPFSAAGDGVKVITNFDINDSKKLSQINSLEKLSKKRNNFDFIIQEYHKGLDLSLQGFISKSGKVYFVGHGIQDVDTFGEYNGLEVLLNNPKEKHISLLNNVGNYAYLKGFYGFFGLDLKETNDEKLYIIDPNFRPTDGTPKYLKSLGII